MYLAAIWYYSLWRWNHPWVVVLESMWGLANCLHFILGLEQVIWILNELVWLFVITVLDNVFGLCIYVGVLGLVQRVGLYYWVSGQVGGCVVWINHKLWVYDAMNTPAPWRLASRCDSLLALVTAPASHFSTSSLRTSRAHSRLHGRLPTQPSLIFGTFISLFDGIHIILCFEHWNLHARQLRGHLDSLHLRLFE